MLFHLILVNEYQTSWFMARTHSLSLYSTTKPQRENQCWNWRETYRSAAARAPCGFRTSNSVQYSHSVRRQQSSVRVLRARFRDLSLHSHTHTVHSVFTCLRLSWCVCACLWVCARVWFKNLCMYKCVLAAHEHQNRGPYAINQFLQILLPEHTIGCGCFVNRRANYIYQQHNRHMCPHSQTNPYIHPHPHTHTYPHPRRAPETAKRPRPRHYQ